MFQGFYIVRMDIPTSRRRRLSPFTSKFMRMYVFTLLKLDHVGDSLKDELELWDCDSSRISQSNIYGTAFSFIGN